MECPSGLNALHFAPVTTFELPFLDFFHDCSILLSLADVKSYFSSSFVHLAIIVLHSVQAHVNQFMSKGFYRFI